MVLINSFLLANLMLREPKILTEVDAVRQLFDAGAIEIRDVDAGDEPFVYSTGNRGPGYVMIKGLVGQPGLFLDLTWSLANKIHNDPDVEFDFVEGNATGGMIPGWQLRNDLSKLAGKQFPFCYLRGSRKKGGHGELITGNRNNPLIWEGMSVLVNEELVNYAGTSANAAVAFREAGYVVRDAACIFTYDHQQARDRLEEHGLNLVSLLTLPRTLDISEEERLSSPASIAAYRSFLEDPIAWQLDRGMVVPEDTARAAIAKGYTMRPLNKGDAIINHGAPREKALSGITYWKQDD